MVEELPYRLGKRGNKGVWCICKSTAEIINHENNLDKDNNEGRRNLRILGNI